MVNLICWALSSSRFAELARETLMSRQLADLRLAVMMIDGIELKERMMIVALGITTEGVKIPLGLLPTLAIAIERRLHLHQPNTSTTEEAAIAVTM